MDLTDEQRAFFEDCLDATLILADCIDYTLVFNQARAYRYGRHPWDPDWSRDKVPQDFLPVAFRDEEQALVADAVFCLNARRVFRLCDGVRITGVALVVGTTEPQWMDLAQKLAPTTLTLRLSPNQALGLHRGLDYLLRHGTMRRNLVYLDLEILGPRRRMTLETWERLWRLHSDGVTVSRYSHTIEPHMFPDEVQ